MMVYLKANMGILPTQLSTAMELAQQVHFDSYVGLGWQKMLLSDGQIITWFAGGAAGHQTFIAFNINYNTGVVVLYNIRYDAAAPAEVGKKILEIARKY